MGWEGVKGGCGVLLPDASVWPRTGRVRCEMSDVAFGKVGGTALLGSGSRVEVFC